MQRQAMLIITAIAVLSACDGFKEAMSAHQDVVAHAGSQELSVKRLGELLGNSKAPLRKDVAKTVSELWIDYQLLGIAAARGDSLNDPRMVDSAMWSAISSARAKKWYDRVSKTWGGASAAGEAEYNQGDMLAARHILLVVPEQGLTTASKEQIRKKADAIRARITPANFAKLATENSMDPGSKARGGALGVFPKGVMVPEFEKAILALKPGQISPVIQTQFGYHIIMRQPYAEVKDEFARQNEAQGSQAAEQTYLKNLEESAKIELKPTAAATTKAIAADVDAHLEDKTVVATSVAGDFTAGKLARWISAFPPQAQITKQLQAAPDSVIPVFLKNVLRNELVLRQADSAKVELDSAEIGSIRRQFASSIVSAWSELGVDPKALSDSAKSQSEKERLAAARVEDYLDRLLAQRARFIDVPKALGTALETQYKAAKKVSDAGLDRAIERATRIRAVTDSTQAPKPSAESQVPMPGGLAPGATPLRPAPNPAPPPVKKP